MGVPYGKRKAESRERRRSLFPLSAFCSLLTSCGRGGIGRHARLRIWCRKVWRFKSSRPHHTYIRKSTLPAVLSRAPQTVRFGSQRLWGNGYRCKAVCICFTPFPVQVLSSAPHLHKKINFTGSVVQSSADGSLRLTTSLGRRLQMQKCMPVHAPKLSFSDLRSSCDAEPKCPAVVEN